MKRFLLHTFGSLGDLHPFIALGLGLKARGHQVSIGTVSHYQQHVEAAGLGLSLSKKQYKAKNVMRKLEQLLGDDRIKTNALEFGKKIRRAERGLENACNAVEKALKV